MENNTTYLFYPSARQGLGASIRENNSSIDKRVSFEVQIALQDQPANFPAITKQLSLLGPGDILGFNIDQAIVRLEPPSSTDSFEANYFPFVEFLDPDFPWRYTTAGAQGETGEHKGLLPWLTLLVLKAAEGDVEGEFRETPISERDPALPGRISILAGTPLPNLTEAWKWAHVQVIGQVGMDHTSLLSQIQESPGTACSRLMCARKLSAGTKYCAFIVPTFKLGQQAGLGEEFDDETDALTLAWNQTPAEDFLLPYYHKWEFRTGARGDFESLARLLEAKPASGLGLKQVDCERPGYGLSLDRGEEGEDRHLLNFEGALTSLDLEERISRWGMDATDGQDSSFRNELKGLINQSSDLVKPGIYGKWHADMNQLVEEEGAAWVHELNLDPRHRAAAGLGAQVMRENQEAFIGAAWEQMGSLTRFNETLRKGQLARELSGRLFDRMKHMEADDLLKFTHGVQSKIKSGTVTVQRRLDRSPIPNALQKSAGRKLFRKNSPIHKRQQNAGKSRKKDLLGRLNQGALDILQKKKVPHGSFTSDLRFNAKLQTVNEPNTFNSISGIVKDVEEGTIPNVEVSLWGVINGRFKLLGKAVTDGSGQYCIPSPAGTFYLVLQFQAKFFRLLLQLRSKENLWLSHVYDRQLWVTLDDDITSWLGEVVSATEQPLSAPLPALLQVLEEKLNPEKTIVARLEARLKKYSDESSFSSQVSQRKGPNELNLLHWHPTFKEAMYRYLADQYQDFLLPGVADIPQNSVLLLRTNRRFMEAFLLGLNHEFVSELRWREFPTDMKATAFRKFWDLGEPAFTETLLLNFQASPHGERFLSALQVQIADILAGNITEADARKLEREMEVWFSTNQQFMDIPPIPEWDPIARLGQQLSSFEEGEQLVLLIRGRLLNRYPNTLIYMARRDLAGDPSMAIQLEDHHAGKDSANPILYYPAFSGSIVPDIYFFGFAAISETSIRAESDRYFLIFEERVTETHFGLDEHVSDTETASGYDNLSWTHFKDGGSDIPEDHYINEIMPTEPALRTRWEKGAAAIASLCLQKPVRVIIPISSFLT